jgi:hypothetical protein
MGHKRAAFIVALGVVVLVLATACAAVPAAPAEGQAIGPSAFGPTFDSLTVPAFDLFAAPAANEMRSISLSHAAEQLTTQQLYDAFYYGVGGCDRHHDLFLQEDLGAAGDATSGN